MLLRRYKEKAEVETKEEQQPVNLEDMKVPQLKELAKEKGHEGVSQLNKGELIALLKGE